MFRATKYTRVPSFILLCKSEHYFHISPGKNNWTAAQWSKVLFSDESTFCISFGNQGLESGGRLERHRIHVAWSPVWGFHSQWWFGGTVTSASVCLLCLIKSKVSAAIYQEILEHFMLPSADKLYGDADLLFMQDFSTCPHCQKHFQVVCWPWYYCAWLARQHAWPEPCMELGDIFKRTMKNSWSINTDEMKAQ